jgi:hypothetical protein
MKKILILLGLLLLPTMAEAQTSRNPCYTTSGQSGTMPNCIGVGTATPLPVYQGGATFTNIAGAASTVIKTSAGTLQGFTVNTAGTSATFYNNTTCTGDTIGIFTTAAQTSIRLDAAFDVGLCVTTVGAPTNITVMWR